jgi:N-dimethylarginine dimethylaminohydrolase
VEWQYGAAGAKMMMIQSDTALLQRLLLKHPRDAFVSQEALGRQWRDLNYLGEPDLKEAIREYDAFVDVISRTGTRIDFLGPDTRTGPDSIYVRDAAVTCSKGVILCRMGKTGRRGEPTAMGVGLQSESDPFPVLGAITGEGRLEGGDVAWVSPRCLAVGRSNRTNAEGIRQLRQLLGDCIDDLLEVPLPNVKIDGDCFHLMSIFSPLADDVALVYPPLLPAAFRDALLERSIRLAEVPEPEFDSMGCNVLAIAPGQVIAVDGNPLTRRNMEQHGLQVTTISAQEISLKGAGGPTCLTRPLVRVSS